jgi:hypothetical protein
MLATVMLTTALAREILPFAHVDEQDWPPNKRSSGTAVRIGEPWRTTADGDGRDDGTQPIAHDPCADGDPDPRRGRDPVHHRPSPHARAARPSLTFDRAELQRKRQFAPSPDGRGRTRGCQLAAPAMRMSVLVKSSPLNSNAAWCALAQA